MQFQGAVIKEQGVTFAIVVVKRHVLDNRLEADRAQHQFRQVFGTLPIILMAQDGRGRPTYYGRRDIVRFLGRIPFRAIPWREYTLTAG